MTMLEDEAYLAYGIHSSMLEIVSSFIVKSRHNWMMINLEQFQDLPHKMCRASRYTLEVMLPSSLNVLLDLLILSQLACYRGMTDITSTGQGMWETEI